MNYYYYYYTIKTGLKSHQRRNVTTKKSSFRKARAGTSVLLCAAVKAVQKPSDLRVPLIPPILLFHLPGYLFAKMFTVQLQLSGAKQWFTLQCWLQENEDLPQNGSLRFRVGAALSIISRFLFFFPFVSGFVEEPVPYAAIKR